MCGHQPLMHTLLLVRLLNSFDFAAVKGMLFRGWPLCLQAPLVELCFLCELVVTGPPLKSRTGRDTMLCTA